VFVCGPNFTKFFSPNVEGVVVDKILFGFAMYGSVPEIFAIKVESCQKSRRMLDVFLAHQILGGGPSKSYTYFITPTLRHVEWKKFSLVRILPLVPKFYLLMKGSRLRHTTSC